MSDDMARVCSFRTTIVVLFNLGVSDEYYSSVPREMDGSYRPNPVKMVEILKDNDNMRLLGISTVVDHLVQHAFN